jgi:hypothetical protein
MDAIDNLEMKSLKRTEEAAPSAPTIKEGKSCIPTIVRQATRGPHCTAELRE